MTNVAYGIGHPASRAVLSRATYCAEALAFFGRLATPPTEARKALYDALISALVAGGVWGKLDVLQVYAASDQATALTNLIQSSYGATAVNSPTFTADQGFTGASTKYINTNFNPTTASSPKYGLSSASIFAWGDQVAANSGGIMGPVSGSGLYLYPRFSDNKFYALVHATHVSEIIATSGQVDGSGLYVAVRESGSSLKGYKNNATLLGTNSVSASLTLPNVNIAVLMDAGAYYTGGKCYCAGLGQSLTSADVSALYTALHTYLQTVAGVA